MIIMNVKKNTLIALLLTCLVAGSTLSAYADEYRPHLQVLTTDTTFSAGSVGEFEITLFNGGDYDIIEVEAILSSTTAGITPLGGAQMVYANIEDSVTYGVDVLIDEDVAVGAYVLTLQLSYLINGYQEVDIAVPVGIVVDEPALPMTKITASTNKITPGEVNTVKLTILNIADSDINDVVVSLSSPNYLISLEEQVNYRVSTLGAGESASFETHLRVLENTPIAAYSIAAQIWYKDDAGFTSTQTTNIPLEVTGVAVVKSPVVTVSNLSPATVIPGDEFTLNLRASCFGAPIYNAKAVLSVGTGGYISPMTQTTVALGDLPVGGYTGFSYTLLLSGSASAGDLPLTVAVNYLDSKGVTHIVTETITVPVEDLIEFSLMEDVVIVAERGEETEFESDLLLIGTGKVEFASIGVVADGLVERVIGSTEYMGAIDPDSPVPFTLRFKVKNGTIAGDYDVKLRVTYLDSRNIEQGKTIEVPLQVVNPTINVTKSDDGGVWGWIKRLFGMQ